jgi:hypothetical protein
MEHKTEWAHLPNAHIIDAILDSAKAHPEKWFAAWDSAWASVRSVELDAAWESAWDAARDVTRETEREAAWESAWDSARKVAKTAAWDLISALIVWDDSADILRMPLDDITVLAKRDNPAAVLLLTAAHVMHKHPEVLAIG